MALVYKTTRHMRVGSTIAPPGTTISDPSARDIATLIDKGAVTVIDDSVGSTPDETDVVVTSNIVSSSGATETLDADVSRYHEVTLDANCTLTIDNLATGEQMAVLIKQDGTGGRTLTIGSELTDGGTDVVGDLDTTASSMHLLVLLKTNSGLVVLLAASSIAAA